MLLKIKNVLSCSFILLICISCTSKYKNNESAIEEACKYSNRVIVLSNRPSHIKNIYYIKDNLKIKDYVELIWKDIE